MPRKRITKQQQKWNKFFDEVKGKPIRWTGWGDTDGTYFIPEKLSVDEMRGKTYNGSSDHEGIDDCWWVHNGFECEDDDPEVWVLRYDLLAAREVLEVLGKD